MLLTEYDEVKHYDRVYRNAKEEGREEERQKGIQEGIQEGMQKGEQNEKLKIARSMREDGVMPERISLYTGLTVAQIAAL